MYACMHVCMYVCMYVSDGTNCVPVPILFHSFLDSLFYSTFICLFVTLTTAHVRDGKNLASSNRKG